MRSLAVLAVLLTVPVFAAPATTRAGEDGSGPRAALLLYDKLIGPNEAGKALGLYHATTTRERGLAAALAEVDGALANLHQRAAQKFGRQAADDLVRAIDGVTTADINAARIEVSGDTASVMFPGSMQPTQMVRVGGEWKISVKAMAKGLRSKPRVFRKALSKIAAAASEASDKIQQGQYPTAEIAKEQLVAMYRDSLPRND